MKKDDKCPLCGGPMAPNPCTDLILADKTGIAFGVQTDPDYYAPLCAHKLIDGKMYPVLIDGDAWPCYVEHARQEREKHSRN